MELQIFFFCCDSSFKTGAHRKLQTKPANLGEKSQSLAREEGASSAYNDRIEMKRSFF
jgi:hypothetical protein